MSKYNKEIIINEFKPDFSLLIKQFPELAVLYYIKHRYISYLIVL